MPDTFWPDFNDLWDYSDPAASEAAFRARLAEAEGQASDDYILQLKTQIARTHSLRGQFDEAHTILDEVQAAMEPGGLAEVRYLLERGRTLNSSRQPEKAMLLFTAATTAAQKLGADFYTVDALHMLGIAAPPEARLDWNLLAIQYAENSEDEHARNWLASLYNNTGWTLFDGQRHEEALDLFQRAVPLREKQGNPENLRIARWSVAKILRALGRVDEALQTQRLLEAEEEDPGGFTLEEIGECLLALGRTNEAKPYFARAYEKLKEIDWVAEDTERIKRLESLAEG